MSDEEDRLFNNLDRLLLAIGDDALSLVMHLNEGIEAFKVQVVLVFGLVSVVTVFAYTAFSISQPEVVGWLPYYLAMGLYAALLLYATWLGARTALLYRSYRARYGKMIQAAKKFQEAAKLGGKLTGKSGKG